MEEERFSLTIDRGSELLDEYIRGMKDSGESVLSGDKVFKLYDEMGFSPELTRELLAEHGIGIDEDGYLAELQLQQERSRRGRKLSDAEAWSDDDQIVADLKNTLFTGYGTLHDRARVVRIISGAEVTDTASAGETVGLILDRTPFYAESGGQAADVGELSGEGSFASVQTVKKLRGVLIHQINIENGNINVGDELTATVCATMRNRTARNHTATHILHKALRDALGNHVRQVGSSVDAETLRFDFSHYEGIDREKLDEIEATVNRVVDEFLPVVTTEMNADEAKEKGAMALFDEKYGDTVRVVEVGDYSMELCGGTHIHNSGEIGAFKIISESSVGSGTRRIEAITGTNVLKPLVRAENIIGELSRRLKAKPDTLIGKISEIQSELISIRKELNEVKNDQMGNSIGALLASAVEADGGKLVTGSFEGLSTDDLRSMADDIRAAEKDVIAALASVTDGKVIFIVAVSDSMQQKGHRAGDIVKAMAQAAGGGGGGKADIAQAGAKDITKVSNALTAAVDFILNE